LTKTIRQYYSGIKKIGKKYNDKSLLRSVKNVEYLINSKVYSWRDEADIDFRTAVVRLKIRVFEFDKKDPCRLCEEDNCEDCKYLKEDFK